MDYALVQPEGSDGKQSACQNENFKTKGHPNQTRLDPRQPRACVGIGPFGIVPASVNIRCGNFFYLLDFAAIVADAAELVGKCCALNDWGSRSRKRTMRLRVAFRLVPGQTRLSGRGVIVNRATGATARAGVALRPSMAATTAGIEFIRHGLTGRPQPRQQRQPDTGASPVSGNHTDFLIILLMPVSDATLSAMGELCPFPAVVLLPAQYQFKTVPGVVN